MNINPLLTLLKLLSTHLQSRAIMCRPSTWATNRRKNINTRKVDITKVTISHNPIYNSISMTVKCHLVFANFKTFWNKFLNVGKPSSSETDTPAMLRLVTSELISFHYNVDTVACNCIWNTYMLLDLCQRMLKRSEKYSKPLKTRSYLPWYKNLQFFSHREQSLFSLKTTRWTWRTLNNDCWI
jgi:hypothetical protein